MKKVSFLLLVVLIFAFFNIDLAAYSQTPIQAVYAEEQVSGEEQAGGETGSGEQSGENSGANEEGTEKDPIDSGLTVLGVKIEGVWFWLAFAAGAFTLGFYVVKLLASYRKGGSNKEK